MSAAEAMRWRKRLEEFDQSYDLMNPRIVRFPGVGNAAKLTCGESRDRDDGIANVVFAGDMRRGH